MKNFAFFALMLTSLSAFASERCYQVTAVKGIWSRTPELLCVNDDGRDATLTLKSGFANPMPTVTFNFSVLGRARCLDCNKDVFGLANPSNSTINKLSVQFNGRRSQETMKEEGTVTVGATQFFYRSY